MKRSFAGLLAVIASSSAVATIPARAGGNDVAAGLLGGLAIGAIVGSAVAAPPRPVYAPAPVYVAPPPAECYWTYAQPVWDGYRWVRRPVQVCD